MISTRVTKSSEKDLLLELREKVKGMKELTSATSKIQMSNAIFSMSAIEFVKNTNFKAASRGRKSLHHVYEWNKAGNESGRLFRVIKTNQLPGAISVYYKFNNSKTVVPIPPSLKSPGKTGKSVKKSTVFKKKAEIMESGKSTSFITRKTIVFLDRKNLVFVPRGKVINILNPGGERTTHGFSKHFMSWWSTKPGIILRKSGMVESLEKNIARALTKRKAGPQQARDAIRKTTDKYTVVRNVL